ncbi:YfiR family protein [Phenylobacterium hankyongense]|uniref:YfiR family protein n=1 Tax=Phenylobacterium hankyongense TaxID=1813876 RepID=UPI0014024C2A|nr:YfiR family protein [Phenylobacterium hankyongense]
MRRALGLLTLAALCAAATVGGAWAQPTLEFSVKAAFLTKFPAFVTWPESAMTPSEPLRICVVGDDPFGPALEQSAQGRALEDHPLAVRRLAVVDRASGCHVLYALGSSRQSAAQALQAVRGAPVLTVTDAAQGGARGMIHFVVFQDRVRFQIDALQAAQSGLSMSSKLLALALTVKR